MAAPPVSKSCPNRSEFGWGGQTYNPEIEGQAMDDITEQQLRAQLVEMTVLCRDAEARASHAEHQARIFKDAWTQLSNHIGTAAEALDIAKS